MNSYSESLRYRMTDRYVAYNRPNSNSPWTHATTRVGTRGHKLLIVVTRLNRIHGWQKYAYAQTTESY